VKPAPDGPEKCGAKTISNISEIAARWGVDKVYQVISEELKGGSRLQQEICRYLLRSPGKGLRPLLVLICAGFGRKKGDAVTLAAGMELLHIATLVHDDVIDGAARRRGSTSINARWSEAVAVLTGDMLFAKSLKMVQKYGAGAAERFAGIIEDMVAGEFQQMETLFDPSLNMVSYMTRIAKKTASFFSSCCALGAVAAEAGQKEVDLLERFGYFLGVAFQIKDDILDWDSTEKKLGKPVCQDLQRGVLTLPVLRALQVSRQRKKLKEIIKKGMLLPGEMDFIREEINRSGALAFARNIAAQYGRQALENIDGLPAAEGREHLKSIVQLVVGKEA